MPGLIQYIKNHRVQIYNIFKWLTIPIVFGVLYYQLFVISDAEQAWNVFKNSLSGKSIWYLLICFLLVPMNLGTEAVKWRILVSKLHPFSLKESFESFLAGISLSIFTPKRVGEFAGRIMLLKQNKKEGITAMFVGNLSQAIANLIIGLLSISLFLRKFDIEYENIYLIIAFSALVGTGLIWAYFNLKKVIQRFHRVKFFRKHLNFLYVIDRYPLPILIQLLCLSFVKYSIFILQFVLIVMAFGIEIPLFWGIICASSVFFVKTMLPVPASVELAARGSIAMYFFGFFTNNDIGILVASILLWVINLAIPAMIGSYIISKSKIETG